MPVSIKAAGKEAAVKTFAVRTPNKTTFIVELLATNPISGLRASHRVKSRSGFPPSAWAEPVYCAYFRQSLDCLQGGGWEQMINLLNQIAIRGPPPHLLVVVDRANSAA